MAGWILPVQETLVALNQVSFIPCLSFPFCKMRVTTTAQMGQVGEIPCQWALETVKNSVSLVHMETPCAFWEPVGDSQELLLCTS